MKYMSLLRRATLILLSIIALVPNAVSAMVWGVPNLIFAFVIVSAMLVLALAFPRYARYGFLPMAAVMTLPPYPYWLYVNNAGSYLLMLNIDGIKNSAAFFGWMYCTYALLFLLMTLVARRQPEERRKERGQV